MAYQIVYGNQPLFLGDDTTPKNPGTLVPLGGVKFAVLKPNGRYLSLPPNGIQSDSATIGEYETFTMDGKFMLIGVAYTQSDGSAQGVPVKLWLCYAGH